MNRMEPAGTCVNAPKPLHAGEVRDDKTRLDTESFAQSLDPGQRQVSGAEDLPLFSLAAGRAAKQRGLALVTLTNADFIARMRGEREAIADLKGVVHIDDLRRRAFELGLKPTTGAAWGACLGGKGWRKIGYRASEWPGNHAHESPVWARVEAA